MLSHDACLGVYVTSNLGWALIQALAAAAQSRVAPEASAADRRAFADRFSSRSAASRRAPGRVEFTALSMVTPGQFRAERAVVYCLDLSVITGPG
jgi:hypothetical protein